jgi:hypothetical protein
MDDFHIKPPLELDKFNLVLDVSGKLRLPTSSGTGDNVKTEVTENVSISIVSRCCFLDNIDVKTRERRVIRSRRIRASARNLLFRIRIARVFNVIHHDKNKIFLFDLGTSKDSKSRTLIRTKLCNETKR